MRPNVPLHATIPYTRNAPNFSRSRDLIRYAKSILDVTNAEPLFYVGTSGKLLCRCCTSCTGFTIPRNITQRSQTHPNRQILTDEWRNFKKGLRCHLGLPSHLSESVSYYQLQGRQAAYTRSDTEAGLVITWFPKESARLQLSRSIIIRTIEANQISGQMIRFMIYV